MTWPAGGGPYLFAPRVLSTAPQSTSSATQPRNGIRASSSQTAERSWSCSRVAVEEIDGTRVSRAMTMAIGPRPRSALALVDVVEVSSSEKPNARSATTARTLSARIGKK